MFLLASGRHVGAHLDGHQHGVSLQISMNLGKQKFSACLTEEKFLWPRWMFWKHVCVNWQGQNISLCTSIHVYFQHRRFNLNFCEDFISCRINGGAQNLTPSLHLFYSDLICSGFLLSGSGLLVPILWKFISAYILVFFQVLPLITFPASRALGWTFFSMVLAHIFHTGGFDFVW